MRVVGVVPVMAMLIAISWVGSMAGSAHAEQSAVPAAAEAVGSAPKQGMPRARSRQTPAERASQREAWWNHAREVLFRDIELSPEQLRGVDAIVERQEKGREQLDEVRTELGAAQKAGDSKRVGELRAELRKGRAKLKSSQARIDEMRALLSDAQRPTFDLNRAHLVAERQQSRQARQRKRPRQPGADAAGPGAEAQ